MNRIAVALLMLLGAVRPAQPADRIGAALGQAPGVTMIQGSMTWVSGPGSPLSRFSRALGAESAWQAGISAWHSDAPGGARRSLVGVGLTPMLRWPLSWAPARGLFAEAGIGPRLWSGLSIGTHQRFGTEFEFGTIIGVGTRFGEGERYEISLRVEHLSNASIRQPNPGINFIYLQVSVPYGR